MFHVDIHTQNNEIVSLAWTRSARNAGFRCVVFRVPWNSQSI